MNEIIFSIIVLSYNSERYLQHMLQSIQSSISTYQKKTEVFIIDNGSNDNSVKILKEFIFNSELVDYRPIFLEKNYGTTYSRNLGLKQSKGEYIIIMDSDAYMNHETMSTLQEYLHNNESCGLVVPKLIYPDGRAQLSIDQFPTIINKLKRFFFLKQIEKNKQLSNGIQKVDYAISAFWMLPKKTLDKVGYLDEKIFYSPEDVDYCIRIWKSNLNIIFLPLVSLIHDAQEISRPKGFKMINKFTISHAKGLIYLFLKHRYLFSTSKLRKTS